MPQAPPVAYEPPYRRQRVVVSKPTPPAPAAKPAAPKPAPRIVWNTTNVGRDGLTAAIAAGLKREVR